MKRHVEFALSLVLASVLVGTALGCGGSQPPAGQPDGELSGTINEAGSTSVQPLAEKMANAFMEKHPRVRVNVSGGGSSAGVKACAAGTVDIGAASRDVKLTEPDLIPHAIARDAVVVVVHSGNAVFELTTEQVAKVYAGETTNWKDVGGGDQPIVLVCREEGSGTRDGFEQGVTKKYGKKITQRALFYDSNGAIRTKVSSEPAAISFLSLGYAEALKVVALDGVVPSMETCMTGEYPVLRRLYLLTRDEPAGVVRAFLEFCRGEEGQRIAAGEGYIPLSR